MIQPLPTTNPIAACVDDDDDHTIVIPPRTSDDYVIVFAAGFVCGSRFRRPSERCYPMACSSRQPSPRPRCASRIAQASAR